MTRRSQHATGKRGDLEDADEKLRRRFHGGCTTRQNAVGRFTEIADHETPVRWTGARRYRLAELHATITRKYELLFA